MMKFGGSFGNQRRRPTLTERFVTAFGFGCGVVFAAVGIATMLFIMWRTTNWEGATLHPAGTTIIWTPEN